MNGLAKANLRNLMTDYCKGLGEGSVSDECIKRAKKSSNKEIRKLGTRAMSVKNLGKGD